MRSEVKPCPFCGGEAKVRRFEFGYKAFCDKPFCCWMGTFRTEQEAVNAWNNRSVLTCDGCKHDGLQNYCDYCERCVRDEMSDNYEPKEVENA